MNNRQHTPNGKINILYQRLSREDGDKIESESIQNQRRILEEYAERNGFTPYINVHDDGYSGTNWNRPGWQEVMEKVEAGEVNAIIAKDSTRIARDYVRMGLLRETLQSKNVRLICVNDGYDSSINGDDDFTPFRDVFAEMHAKDTSKKVKAVLHSKGRRGQHMTNSAIYGYKKSPEDKNAWLVDDEAAVIVRRIFQMTIDGKGPYQIARTLTDEKQLRPTAYIAIRDGYDIPNPNDKYIWGGQSVKNILDKPEYMGHTVNFRTYKDSFKSKKYKVRPQDEWVIFENTQTPIVDKITWETAQKCRVVKRRENSTGEANPLTGIVFCADCGGRMYNHRGTLAWKYDSQDRYACCQYSKYPPKCTMHHIKTSVLQTLALDAIRCISGFAKENEAEFVRLVREMSDLQSEETEKQQKKQFAKNQKRHTELNTLIKRLYEDKVNGELSAKRFEILSQEYEQEQEDLERQIAELQSELDRIKEDGGKADKFIAVVRKYTEFTELTATILNEFIDKIVVYEADKSNGRREQQVDIYLNFIGMFNIPRQEETEPFDPAEHRKAQFRAYYHRNREKILAEKAEKREAEKAEKLAAMPVKTSEEIAAEEEARSEKKKSYQRNYQREWQKKKREQAKQSEAASEIPEPIGNKDTA